MAAANKAAGRGGYQSSLLGKVFGPTIGKFMHAKIKNKAIDTIHDIHKQKKINKIVEKSQRNLTTEMAAANKAAGRGGYQSSFGRDSGFMSGKGTAAEMGSFANGGLVTLFTEKR
jgi:hypothetical protein